MYARVGDRYILNMCMPTAIKGIVSPGTVRGCCKPPDMGSGAKLGSSGRVKCAFNC